MLHGIIGFIVFCVAWELMFGQERRKKKKEEEEWRERNWG
jgi:small neutral amino acid transporter SnatA (MarC family)